MTMQPSLAPPPPTKASPRAFWAKFLTHSEFLRVTKEVAQEKAQEAMRKLEQARTALFLERLSPEERLASYRYRPPETWALIERVFPKTYKENMLDWRELEFRVMKGELNEEKLTAALQEALAATAPDVMGAQAGALQATEDTGL